MSKQKIERETAKRARMNLGNKVEHPQKINKQTNFFSSILIRILLTLYNGKYKLFYHAQLHACSGQLVFRLHLLRMVENYSEAWSALLGDQQWTPSVEHLQALQVLQYREPICNIYINTQTQQHAVLLFVFI